MSMRIGARGSRGRGRLRAFVFVPGLFVVGCGSDAGARAAAWAGTIDTLPSGRIVVTNPPLSSVGAASRWTATEELRIGALDDPGPYEFGQVTALDVDELGRIWALEGQAKEIRVFDAEGRYVRTVGGSGNGPGEFAGPADIAFGPEGRLWVADPQNNRISVIDTTGAFVASHRMDGGFFMLPWPGGFDDEGRYYLPAPGVGPDGQFRIGIVRYALPDLVPLDTIPRLSDPVEREQFELRTDDGRRRMAASIPFAPGFRSARSPRGTWWGLLTGEYRMFEVAADGDTLRTVATPYEPLPVTAADREAAREGLSWFTDEGGKIDLSKIPNRKPAARRLFVDASGRIWVDRYTERAEGQDWDVFDPEGRLLGRVALPVPVSNVPRVRGDLLYGVMEDELEVPYLVRIRVAPAG